jgi:mannose-6-phosphate isomerase-like protein (cupin superfamily)
MDFPAWRSGRRSSLRERPLLRTHQCKEAVRIDQGSGQVACGEQSQPFGPGSILVFGPGEVHQIVNGDKEEIVLLAALSESPARVFAPDGEQINLPWQQL